jgi:ankyrin repeat protein
MDLYLYKDGESCIVDDESCIVDDEYFILDDIKIPKKYTPNGIFPHMSILDIYKYIFIRVCSDNLFDIASQIFKKLSDDININEIIDDAFLDVCSNGSIEMINWILEKGADINYNFNGYNGIIYATSNNRIDVVKHLIIKKCNIHAKNNFAFALSAYDGYLDIAKILYYYGANIHDNDDSAFELSFFNRKIEVIEWMCHIDYYPLNTLDMLNSCIEYNEISNIDDNKKIYLFTLNDCDIKHITYKELNKKISENHNKYDSYKINIKKILELESKIIFEEDLLTYDINDNEDMLNYIMPYIHQLYLLVLHGYKYLNYNVHHRKIYNMLNIYYNMDVINEVMKYFIIK